MEAGFLGAAAAPEPQERPAGIEQKRARPVLNAPPAIRGRRDFPGVDSGKNLHAAAAASHSERCGHGHGETMRTRTLPARSARPPHPSRTPFPTLTPSRSSRSHVDRLSESMIERLRRNDGLLDIQAHCVPCAHVRGGMRRKVERRLSAYACRMFCVVFVPHARA